MERADRQSQSETLSAALRLIRAHRRMKSADVARGMNMALRSYEHFEAGGGRINLERVHRFAEVTDSDPHAIMAALALGSPAFALRCADNKLMTIFTVAVQEFDEEVGDAITELDARTIINTFTKALKELAVQSVRRDSAADAWLEQRLRRLVSPANGDGDGPTGDGTPWTADGLITDWRRSGRVRFASARWHSTRTVTARSPPATSIVSPNDSAIACGWPPGASPRRGSANTSACLPAPSTNI